MRPRTAQPNDAPYILDIDTKHIDYYWTANQWGEVWSAQGVCILVAGEPPVGFCVMVEDMVYQEPAIHIPKLVVQPSARGQGLGRKFLASVYRYCQGERVPRIASSIPLSNTHGCEWFKTMGFRAVKLESQLLYGQDEDVILFVRDVECLPQHRVL